MNEEQFIQELDKRGIQLSEFQLAQFTTYFESLVEWNEKINLTSLVSKEDVYLKHFFDSLSLSFYYEFSDEDSICDVGSGAGFPSIPLKICYPHLQVTIVDSLKKRIGFLEHLAKELSLTDVHFYHARAEEFGNNKEFRGSFDIVTARAVARMSVLSELCIPLCKKDGVFIAMKGSQASDELDIGMKAISQLGGQHNRTETLLLPFENSERSIIFIDKLKNSPKKYPRKPGVPNRNPIE